MNIRLVDAAERDIPRLHNLFQFYIHDFSEFWAGQPQGDLQADGRFEAYPLAPYFETPGWNARFVTADGALAGFVLVNDRSHSGLAVDHNVAEFFVARKYRRSGVGLAAAHAVFAATPGRWEAAVVRKNLAAQGFWRRAAASAPGAREVEELDVSSADWNGPIIRFSNG